MTETLKLRVHRLEWQAEGVLEVELRGPSELPPFTSGAHIDLHLPNGLSRSYSLTSLPEQRDRYCVGVGLDASSKGGSRYIHTQLRPGQVLDVDPPRNNFPLEESAARTVLLAGGIGVTPILSHARRLAELGKDFVVHHAVQERSRAAFTEALGALGACYHLHVDAEHAGAVLPLPELVAQQPDGTHFYCCGPEGMMNAFEQATATLPPEQVHVEYFVARQQATSGPEAPFTLVLQKQGVALEVPPDQSMLEVLLNHGYQVPNSCRDGICGSCETRVLEGLPDHRDSVLSASERASNKTVMLCISRCQGDRLVIDR